MEQEKDNFWLYVGGVCAAALVTVFLVVSNERKDDAAYEKAYNEVTAQEGKSYKDIKSISGGK
jgi:hypothetical protein